MIWCGMTRKVKRSRQSFVHNTPCTRGFVEGTKDWAYMPWTKMRKIPMRPSKVRIVAVRRE